jgi:hypothetical protein
VPAVTDLQLRLGHPRTYPALRLPTSYQWRIAAEKQIGTYGVSSIAYVGAFDRNLLGNEAYVDPTGLLQRTVTLTENSSNYQALELRHTGSLARNLCSSLSYTWAHSIDDGSLDSSIFLIHPGYSLSEARGSSDFDVRHSFTAALSYRIPTEGSFLHLPFSLGGWTVSGILRAHSGFPIDVQTNAQPLGQGFDNVGQPNLIPDIPIWIADPTAPGGRRLNAAAFLEDLSRADRSYAP